MPDICDLILEEHQSFRTRFAELDEAKAKGAPDDYLDDLWQPLAYMLDRHADAEERILYPALLATGDDTKSETEDAVGDHNSIRDHGHGAQKHRVGSEDWWNEVIAAREANSKHMAEEERDDLPDFRARISAEKRDALGAKWRRFALDHSRGVDVNSSNKNPSEYVKVGHDPDQDS